MSRRLPSSPRSPRPATALSTGLLIALGSIGLGCAASPTREAQRAYIQEGFGRRYTGDISKAYYAGIGDRVGLQSLQYPDIVFLQEIRPDGKITVPMVGDVAVAGLTAPEIKDKLALLLVEEGLKKAPSDIIVNIPFRASKRVFITGQAGRQGVALLRGDTTVMDVLATVKPTKFADTNDIRILRGDPEHPDVITVNLDEITEEGLTRTNIQLKEDDIIYIPTTNFGKIAIAIDDALFPLKIVLSAVGSIFRAALIPATVEGFDEISARISEGNVTPRHGVFY